MLSALLRTLMFPPRWMAVSLPRGNLLRSASVALIKPFAASSKWILGVGSFAPLDRSDLRFNAIDSMVMRSVYWLGVQGYEGVLAELWRRLAERADNVLEVGGNVGLFTVIGGKATRGRYEVVEPVPEVAASLRSHLELNQLPRVIVHEAAVVPNDGGGTVLLSIPREGSANPVGSHLVEGGEVTGRSSERVIEVPSISFPNLIRNCDLVKIDAEGIEAMLLSSAWAYIVEHRPTLVIEVLPESRELGELLREIAAEAGYRIYVVPAYGSDVPVRVEPTEFDAQVPRRHNSKDIILCLGDLPI
jgi:FkbM family methyltransferase